MKKLAILTAFVLFVVFVNGQNSKIQSAINYSKPQYNQLDKAKEAIDIAVENEKTISSAKAWKVRGDVYLAIAQSPDENFKKLCENPLEVSISSYKKAITLDANGQFKKEINNQLMLVGIAMINKGITCFNESDFNCALLSFETSIEIDEIVTPGKVDSMVVYNAGIAADRAKNYEKAKKYYQQAADMKYEGSKVYGFLATIAKETGDTAAFEAYLKKGIEVYPTENDNLMVALINHYLENEQSNLALEYLSKAIEKDPTNYSYYFAQGALYDKLKDFDNAKASYEKAVEIKPDYFDAYYNLGALYFNKGADMLKEANNIPPKEQARYDAAVVEAFKELEKALPYLEKAHAIDPTEKSTVMTLKEIYFKLRNDNADYMAKYKEMNEKLQNMQ